MLIAGKLRLLRPLGHGGMGVVWAARHLALQTDVAVKFIRPERAAEQPALVARFEREARTTARITHPHVVKVMDYGTALGGVPYIVMELLRGFSLAELLDRGGRLSFATARSLVQQIGSALESAHEHGVVHRDIKPHNVFLTEGSKGYPLFVKVLDFGVAKMQGAADAPAASAALTETGMVIGSAPYMSPEQLEGSKDVDLRSDLWSLAVIAYEALTNTQPFQGTSFVSIGAAVLRGVYPPVSRLRPTLPAPLDDWFAKALCLDPAGRFQSARAMIDAFPEHASPADEAESASPPSGPESASGPGPAPEPESTPGARPDPFATTDMVAASTPPSEPVGATAGHAPAATRPATQPEKPAPAPRHHEADETANHPPAEKKHPTPTPRETDTLSPPHPSDLAPGGTHVETASHAAVTRAPDPRSAPPSRRRWPLVAAVATVAAVAAIAAASRMAGVGPIGNIGFPGSPTSGAACPPGMTLIEGSTFPMGSPADGETPSDETPRHDVAVPPFCLDLTEVTVNAYSECATCGPPARTVEIEGLTPNARTFWSQFCNRPDAGDHPINCVDWAQARAYCSASGKRLPTEPEWELAARGTETRTYPWGFTPPAGERLNACGAECSRMLTDRFEKAGKGPWPAMHPGDDSAPSTAPVGRYPAGASPAGVLDLAGNLWEWTESHYCPYGADDCEDSRRVLRGGGWDTVDSQFVRSAHRRPSAPTARGWSIGFRCAKSP